MYLRRLLVLFLLALVPAGARAASQPVDTVPRIALFSAFEPEWKALLAIVEQPVSHREKGVDFVTGRVEGHDVVLVLSGVSMVNAAMTSQMAIDRFNLRAILFSGIAGGVDPSLNIGDVVVSQQWGQYLETVLARETPQGFQLPSWSKQEFPSYGMIFTRGVKIPRDGVDKPARQFWIPVDAKLFEIARTATSGVELKRCIEAACLVHAPKVVVGGNGVSGSAFVDNAAFRMWTFENFKAQVLDMESAAVAHVAVTNSVPFLAFRSLSDLAGGGAGENEMQTFEKLASENSVAVLRAFLKAMPK
ncbi:MAG: 5'-methylthioadenosine/S-adenosylhomocysteine nucleosidase [Afipia sp.]|nr:5'-methylthioadenosine/S-adenosylhomocysteine nucleosidase [Afipia sp.]